VTKKVTLSIRYWNITLCLVLSLSLSHTHIWSRTAFVSSSENFSIAFYFVFWRQSDRKSFAKCTH